MDLTAAPSPTHARGPVHLHLARRIARHRAPRAAMQPKSLLARLGPGLITASDDDPSGIAAYSRAGAQFGYTMSWVILFCFSLMAAIQEISARIGRVTGEGIAGNIRAHYSRPLLYAIVDLLLVANIIIPAMRHPSGCSSLVSLASNCRVRRYPRVTTADQPRDQC